MLTSGSLCQSTFGAGNPEVLLYRPGPTRSGELRHYWRETDRPDRGWNQGAVLTTAATGAGSIIQAGDHSLHAVVPAAGALAHFRMDPDTTIWTSVPITFAPGATGAAALCQHRSLGNLEVVAR